VALAVAFVVWLVVRGDDSGSNASGPTTTQPGTSTGSQPVLVAATASNLKTLAAVTNHPIYWAGKENGITYELTQTANGRIFIRYLPEGVEIGDRSGSYTIVGTYPVQDAFGAVQSAAEEDGAVTFKLPDGGLAVYNNSSPTNVYFAYPDTDYQVEVYDPDPERARELVASGAVQPIG
jgi:hypothetical protein